MTEKTQIWVIVDDRKFIVTFADGQPRSIKGRKVYAKGKPWEAFYNAPYWHHSAGIAKGSRAARIISAAEDAA